MSKLVTMCTKLSPKVRRSIAHYNVIHFETLVIKTKICTNIGIKILLLKGLLKFFNF